MLEKHVIKRGKETRRDGGMKGSVEVAGGCAEGCEERLQTVRAIRRLVAIGITLELCEHF